MSVFPEDIETNRRLFTPRQQCSRNRMSGSVPDFGSACESIPSPTTYATAAAGADPGSMFKSGTGGNVCGMKVATDYHHVKPDDSTDGTGVTVFGPPSGQIMSRVSECATLGCHSFHFKLLVGDPSRNVLYDGHMDDNGLRMPGF